MSRCFFNLKSLNMIQNSQSILVLASNSTGNNVFMTPAIRLLRKKLPDSIIEVVALSKLSGQVFSACPYINKLHIIKNASVFNKLALAFDHVIPLHQNSIKKFYRLNKPSHPLPELDKRSHHADQLLYHVAYLLKTSVGEMDKQYFLGNPTKSFVDRHAFYAHRPVINIHLGSGKSNTHGWKFWHRSKAEEAKIWNIERYIVLVKTLLSLYPSLTITLTGSRNEAFLAQRFLKKIPSAINLTGQTTVHDLLAHIQHCDLFISHDCGVLHIASATNTPIIALFGPTNHLEYGPYPERDNRIIIKRESTSDIEVDDVITLVKKLLQKT
jgi:ADP-heptose:LPS heptosyltransferase